MSTHDENRYRDGVLVKDSTEKARQWPQDANYWHEKCDDCGLSFSGPKRARHCWICNQNPERKERAKQFHLRNLKDNITSREKEIAGFKARIVEIEGPVINPSLPEKIYALERGDWIRNPSDLYEEGFEYVRADLYEALQAELQQTKAEIETLNTELHLLR